MITTYVLASGSVYPSDKNKENTPKPECSSYHFLVTCKQIFAEGVEIFYSSNIFYLPGIENGFVRSKTQNGLNALRPCRRPLTKQFGVEFKCLPSEEALLQK